MASRPSRQADQWRERNAFACVPGIAAPIPFKEGEAVSSALPRVMKALGVTEGAAAGAVLEAEWANLVGPDIAKHATPGRLEGGELTVRVKGAVWFAELRRTAPRLLLPKVQAVPALKGRIRSIRVVAE